jgi:hypothetical protein
MQALGAHFSHVRGMGFPGYYLRLGPSDGLCGAGLWRLESAALGRIRDAICAKPADWKRATKGLRLDGDTPAGDSTRDGQCYGTASRSRGRTSKDPRRGSSGRGYH